MVGKHIPVMCHIGAAPGSLSDLLDLLRPGDILTHAYSGAGNNTVQNGQLLPAARAAKQRGVIFDVGHGGRSEEHTSELQSQSNLVCRLLLEKKKRNTDDVYAIVGHP